MIFIITATAATLTEDATRIAEFVGTSDTQTIITNIKDYFETTGDTTVDVYAKGPNPMETGRDIDEAIDRIGCYMEPLTNTREEPPATTIQRSLRPRKDWQQKSYWLRIRSNPHRRSYH